MSPSPAVDRDINVNGKRGCLTPRQGQGNAEPEPPPPPSPSNNQDAVNVEVANPNRANDVRPSLGERIRNQYPYNSNRNINLPTSNNMAAFRAAPINMGGKYRERQLEVLNRMEERLRNLSRNPKPQLPKENTVPPPFPSVTKHSPPKMAMFVMDITNVLTELCVKWLPIKSVATGGPEHTILYSLVSGQGEIIMFGGIQKDVSLFSIEESSINVINTVTNTLHFISAPQAVI